MDTPHEQITGILKYLLNQYANSIENRKHIILQLLLNGNVQIDAIGPWIKDFSMCRFKDDLWLINKAITIHTGNVEENTFYKFDIKYDMPSKVFQISTDPFLDVSDYYVSFVLDVEPKNITKTFAKVAQFFKATAPTFPQVKMSFTGDATLWQEKDHTDKYLGMIRDAVGDVIKYDSRMNFRDQVVVKYFNVGNRQDVIDNIYKKLSKKLATIADK